MTNPTIDLLAGRHSIREFEQREIPEEIRDAILNAGLRAPTAGNMMLYSILEIEDQSIKDRLAETCDHQLFIAKSPWVLVFLADYHRWMRYFEYSGVPELCAREGKTMVGPGAGDFLLAVDDTLAAAQNIVIAAESFGLGSCYIGDIMENFETHKEFFGLPAHVFPAAMLCIGYPTARQLALKPRSRFDRKHIVFKNRYVERDDIDFDRMFAAQSASTDGLLPGTANYGQHMYVRKFSSVFMEEMRRSVFEAMAGWDHLYVKDSPKQEA